MPLFELLPQTGGTAAPYARIIDLLGRVPPGELARDRARRSSGRSTAPPRPTGRGGSRWSACAAPASPRSASMLAEKLGVPFIELDRMVEQEYGASVPLLIEMSGVATFGGMNAPASSALSRRTRRR